MKTYDYVGKQMNCFDENCIKKQICMIAKSYDRRGWLVHIDGYENNCIYGWVKKEYDEGTQRIALYINGKLVADDFATNIYRHDLQSKGIGNGCYGFSVSGITIDSDITIFCISDHKSSKVLDFVIYNSTGLETDSIILNYIDELKIPAFDRLRFMLAWNERQPDSIKVLRALIQASIDCQDYKLADLYIEKLVRRTGECPEGFINIAAYASWGDEYVARVTIGRYYRCGSKAVFKHYFSFLNNLFRQVNFDEYPFYKLIYNDFIGFILNKSADSGNKHYLCQNRIGIYECDAHHLNFLAPILRNLPEFLYDIVLGKYSPCDENQIKQLGLENVVIHYGRQHLNNYKIVFLDQCYLLYHKDKLAPGAKIIAFSHATDSPGISGSESHLFLCSSENQCLDKSLVELKNLGHEQQ